MEEGQGADIIKEFIVDTASDALHILKYYTSICHMLQKVIRIENIAKKRGNETQSQLYWKCSIRKTMMSMMQIFNSNNGVIAKYILSNGCTTKLNNVAENAENPPQTVYYTLLHSVTKSVLDFISHLFAFGPRFSKFFTEELSMFYIRTHYLSFTRLYNQGMRAEDQTECKMATSLCKLHLKCLISIAKSRNEETSRNFYKLRCVEALIREMDLEYDMTSRRPNTKKESPSIPMNEQDITKNAEKIENPPEEKKEKSSNMTDELKNKLRLNLKKLELIRDDEKEKEAKIEVKEKTITKDKEIELNKKKDKKEEKQIEKEKEKEKDKNKNKNKEQEKKEEKEIDTEKSKEINDESLLSVIVKPPERKLSSQSNIKFNMKLDLSAINKTAEIEEVKNVSRIISTNVKFNRNVLPGIKKKVKEQEIVKPVKQIVEGIPKKEVAPEEKKVSRIKQQAKEVKPKLALDLHKQNSKHNQIEAPDPAQLRPKSQQIKKEEDLIASIVSANINKGEGVIVGSNKVWIPLLNFPTNIDNYKDDAEEAIKVEKPNEGRFKLKRYVPNEAANKSINAIGPDPTSQLKKAKNEGIADMNKSAIISGQEKEKSTAVIKGISMIKMKIDIKVAKLDVKKEEKSAVSLMKNEVGGATTKPDKKPKIPQLRLDSLQKKNPEKSYKEKNDEELANAMKNEKGEDNKLTEGQLTNIEKSLMQNKQKWQQIKGPSKKAEAFKIDLNQKNNSAEIPQILRERASRNIYNDPELHALMIGLLFCLLLKPPRGTLDDLYCSDNPSDNGKQNILYLLHFHLNHSLNQNILPLLLSIVSKIRPPLLAKDF